MKINKEDLLEMFSDRDLCWTDMLDETEKAFKLKSEEEVEEAYEMVLIISNVITSANYIESVSENLCNLWKSIGADREKFEEKIKKLCDNCKPKSPYAWVAIEKFDGVFNKESKKRLQKEVLKEFKK